MGEQFSAGAGAAPTRLVLRPTSSRRFSVRGSQNKAVAGAVVLDTRSELPLAVTSSDGSVEIPVASTGEAALMFLARGRKSLDINLYPQPVAPASTNLPTTGRVETVRMGALDLPAKRLGPIEVKAARIVTSTDLTRRAMQAIKAEAMVRKAHRPGRFRRRRLY